MIFKRIFQMTIILALSSLSLRAGEYVEKEMTCPIGGEVFTIASTSSCSYFGGKTMGFKSISSCDFIETMPQCPSNKLPIYKDFSDDELNILTKYINTTAYQNAADHSRFYLAYTIEDQAVKSEDISSFQILLAGFWGDYDRAIEDPEYQAAFMQEYENELSEVSAEEAPYLRAIGAYYAFKFGDLDKAKSELASARTLAQKNEPEALLDTYLQKIEACIDHPDQAQCEVDSPIINPQ